MALATATRAFSGCPNSLRPFRRGRLHLAQQGPERRSLRRARGRQRANLCLKRRQLGRDWPGVRAAQAAQDVEPLVVSLNHHLVRERLVNDFAHSLNRSPVHLQLRHQLVERQPLGFIGQDLDQLEQAPGGRHPICH